MRWALDIGYGLLEKLATEVVGIAVPADIVDANAEVLNVAEEDGLVEELKGLTSTVAKQARLADMEARAQRALERGCSSAFTTEAHEKTTSRVAELAKQRALENEQGIVKDTAPAKKK